MTSEQLFDTIGQTEETLLARSEKPHRAALWIKMGVAAVAALAIIIGLAVIGGRPAEPEALPLIVFPEGGPGGSANGYGTIITDNIADLSDSSPWTPDSDIKILPVYRYNGYADNFEVRMYGMDKAAMYAYLNALAHAIGVTVQTVDEQYDDDDSNEPYCLDATTDNGHIKVDSSGFMQIRFNELTTPDGNLDSADTDAVSAWLAERFGAAIGTTPHVQVSRECGYSYNATLETEYVAYNRSDSVAENIVERYLKRMYFYGEPNGVSPIINSVDFLCCSEKLGDYPVVTAEQAKELLLQGYYLYRDVYAVPSAEDIVDVTLMYRPGFGDLYTIPYYRFYVDEGAEGDFRRYMPYYVPAVEGRYLENCITGETVSATTTTATSPTTPTTVKPSGSGGVILELLPENQKGAAPSGTSVAFEKVCSGRIRHFDAPTYQSIADAATYHQIPWEYATGNRPAYDDAFFEDKALIRLDTVLPDPSYSKTVTKLYRNGDVLEVVMVTLHETGAMVPAEAVPYTTVLSVDRAAIEGVTKIAFYNGEAGIPITFRAEGPYAAEVAEFDTEWVFIDSNAQYSSLPWPSAATGIPMYSDSAFIDRRLVSVTLTLPSNCHAVRIDEVRMFENKIENRLVIYYTPTYYSNVDNTGTTKILRLLVWVDREQTEKISYAVITQNTPEFTQADIPPFHWEESAPVKNGPIGTPVSYTQEYLTTGAHDSRDEQLYRPITDVATYQSINWKLSANDTPPTYDTAFFENKALIVLPFVHSAANYRATVTGLYRNGDTLEVLYTQTTIAAVGAAALWENRFLMAVDAADIEGVTRIAFYKNEHDAVVLEETEPTGGTEGPLGTSIEFKSIAYDSGLSADKPLYRTITDLYTYEHLSWSNGYTPPALDADFFETYALVELCDSFPHSGYHWEIDSVSVNSNYTLEIAQTVTLDNGDQVVTGARHLLAIRHTDLKRVGLIAFYTTTTKSPQA